jgi:outer membrane protein assembly factor BamB
MVWHLVVALAASAAVAGGEDWPRFLGPQQDGTSRETGLARLWPASGPPRIWAREVGSAYAAPVVSRGRLIVFHRVGDRELLDCLDAATGAPLWSHGYPTAYEDRYGYNNGPRASPAIDGDRVYALGAEGVLTCLDLASGRLVWQRAVNRDFRVPQGFFGAGTAPVVESGRVLVNAGGLDGAGIVAFDAGDGRTLWQAGSDGASYSTPVVRTIGGKRLAVFFTQAGLVVLDPASGAELHRFPFRSRAYESVNAASPLVVGDLVFLSATYNTGAVLLRLVPGRLETVWRSRDAMQNHWATSIHRDGFVYGTDGRHESGANLRCIELLTGRVCWTSDRGLGRASFLMAEGNLVVLGERGDLALVEVNPERYVEKARARVLHYPCWTPPVLAHGRLYLRNENRIVCLDLRGMR